MRMAWFEAGEYMKGTVIIINGPSASGKSSIQKAVQALFDEPYLPVGIDNFYTKLFPAPYNGIDPKGKFSQKDLQWVEEVEVEGKPSYKLFLGEEGLKVLSGMHKSLGVFANAGNNLVVDYILYDKEWIHDLKEALEGGRVYWVGIQYPLDVIEAREQSRSTTPIGHARSHYFEVHPFEYDLVLDNPEMSPEELALEIKKFVEENPSPSAFNAIMH